MSVVLSLCDRTGVMVQPWIDAGYQCVIVDAQHERGVNGDGLLYRVGCDVRKYDPHDMHPVIVFAFPPCTHLANSGNAHKKDKGLEALYEALGLVIACKRICEASGAPWMIENPVGSLSTYWRKPDVTFHPWQYTTPKEKKRTCLWVGNNFVIPQFEVVDEPADVKESCWKMPPSKGQGRQAQCDTGGLCSGRVPGQRTVGAGACRVSVPSYDDKQANAVLLVCQFCKKLAYYTSQKPVCGRCQEQKKDARVDDSQYAAQQDTAASNEVNRG